MNLLSQLPFSRFVEQLGWTLVHSIWQLAIVGGAYFLFMILPLCKTPPRRYVCGVIVLGVMVLCPVVTFCLQTDPAPSMAVTAEFHSLPAEWTVLPSPLPQQRANQGELPPKSSSAQGDQREPSSIPRISTISKPVEGEVSPAELPESLSDHHPWNGRIRSAFPMLVGAYGIGVALLSLWHLGGWFALIRLRTRGLLPVPESVSHMAARLVHRIGCTSSVEIWTCALIRVPAVVGWLRPMILLPVGLVTGLPMDQLEAVLAHELAHIRRFDYLVNLLQSAAETLLFYHPAVWWVSHCVRREREHCADDWAIQVCGNPLTVARALTFVAQHRQRIPKTTVAFTGSRLRNRILRILGQSPRPTLGQSCLPGVLLVLALIAGMYLAESRFLAAEQDVSGEISLRIWGPFLQQHQPPGTDLYGDPLPKGAIARLGTERYRAGHGIRILFFPDSQRILTYAPHDLDTIRVWDTRTGKLLRACGERRLHWISCDISSDGRILAALRDNWDGTRPETRVHRLEVWDVESWTLRSVITWSRPWHWDHVANSVTLTPDGQVVFVAGPRGMLLSFNVADGTELPAPMLPDEVKKYEIRITFNPDGTHAALLAGSQTYLWNWKAGEKPRLLKGVVRSTNSLEFAPDGNRFAIYDRRYHDIMLWDLRSRPRRVVTRFKWGFERNPPSDLAISPDGTELFAVSHLARNVEVFDVATGEQKYILDAGIRVDGIEMSPDCRLLVAESRRNGVFTIADLSTRAFVDQFQYGHVSGLNVVRFLPDGKHVVTGSEDGTIRVWDAETGQQVRRWQHGDAQRGEHYDSVSDLILSPDGKRIATVGNGPIRIWDWKTGAKLHEIPGRQLPHGPYWHYWMAFNGDGNKISSFGDDNVLRMQKVSTGEIVSAATIAASTEHRQRLHFLPRGEIICVDDQGEVVLLDVASGREIERLQPVEPLIHFAMSPQGGILASLEGRRPSQPATQQRPNWKQEGNTLRLYDIRSKSVLRAIKLGTYGASRPLFSPDGTSFAIVIVHIRELGFEYEIAVFETATGRERARISSFSSRVQDMSFSPDGRRLATMHSDTTGLIWDLDALAVAVAGPTDEAAPPVVQRSLEEKNGATTGPTTPPEQAAIQRGVTFLVSKQNDDGSWNADELDRFRTGVTALATLALARSGVTTDHEAMADALEYLRKQRPEMTYEIALQTLVLCATSPKQDLEIIQHNVEWLEQSQLPTGAWSYTERKFGAAGVGDNSNSEFAIWALDVASRVGAQTSPEVWQRAWEYWRKCQHEDGSWSYNTQIQGKGAGSMTCAGLASLVICGHRVAGIEQPLDATTQQAVERSLKWLEQNYAVRHNPGAGANWLLYYLMNLQRACELTETVRLGEHNWFNEARDFLLKQQAHGAGSWRGTTSLESNPVVATALVVLFLSADESK